MGEAIVEAVHLVKRYGPIVAVDDVSFRIEAGEIFGLLGPNGAGKTTTISILSGLARPTSGEALVTGLNVSKALGKVKRSLGVVPQEIALFPTLSGLDNLRFFARIYDLKGEALRKRVAETLERVALTDRAKSRVQTYSGGMKRRLNLAVGILHHPKVLFLDEPTVGVDPHSRNHLFETVGKLKGEGVTILYTTHYMEEAQQLCDRIGIVDRGGLIALDTPQNLINEHGKGVIRLRMEGEPPGILEKIRACPLVKQVRRTDGTFVVESTDAQGTLLTLIPAFNEAGVTLSALEVLEPNLESVFLQLTGKSLRD